MIIEEGYVIELENNTKYYLAQEIGELEGHEGKTYFFAVGITKNKKFNSNDITFLEIEEENGEYSVSKVPEETELYQDLSCLESVMVAANSVPGFKAKLEEQLSLIEE